MNDEETVTVTRAQLMAVLRRRRAGVTGRPETIFDDLVKEVAAGD